jgi:hypothetical protein
LYFLYGYLLAICTSYFRSCLLDSFSHLLIRLVGLWCLIFGVLYIFWILIFIQWIAGKDFLPLCRFSLNTGNCFPLLCRSFFKLMQSHLPILVLICWAIRDLLREVLPTPITSFPWVFLYTFIISGLTLRSLIHFELTFVQGER